MKIKDGLKLPPGKGGKTIIPDCNRRDLPGFFKEMGYKVGVEIGVQRGSFTRRVADTGLQIYGVDPWLAYDDYCPISMRQYQRKQDSIYRDAQKNLASYSNCTLIRKTSMDAVKDFENESIDFVYIDGHHGFKYVTEDIFEWSKKVKKGGCISGHDYAYTATPPDRAYCLQVKYVVDAYTKAFKIRQWYVLGANEKTKENEKRDQFRSWFWIKK